MAVKYIRKRERFNIFDKDFRILNPYTYFEDIIINRLNTVFLIPESKINTDKLNLNPGNRSHLYPDSAIN
jgi:hypothetical protein